MINSKKALEIILKKAKSMPIESLRLDKALGFVLAQDVTSSINVPPFDNSAMDGFALHKSDLGKKTWLRIRGEVQAGQALNVEVKEGQPVSIMTGAKIPQGTASVIPIENTIVENGKIRIEKPLKFGANIRKQGEDIKKGRLLFKKGTEIKPIHIGICASIGKAQLRVYKKPKIALVITGDEIKTVGAKLKEGEVYDSNSFLITNMLKQLRFGLACKIKAKDSVRKTLLSLKKALCEADIVLTTGGISVGKYDLVASALKKLGAECHFSKVKQKPGKPLSFYTLKDKSVICLPGNPVAVAVCFELYVRPMLLKMSGYKNIHRPIVRARISKRLTKKKGRKNWVRVLCKKENNTLFAEPTGAQGSGILTSMIADGLAILAEEVEEVESGQGLKVISFEGDYK